MQTYDPLKARQWFKLRAPINWAISIVVFIPLVFILQIMFPYLIADAIAIAVIFCLFFFYLHKRAIAIECPSCRKYVATNTPWICAICGTKNLRVDDYPFVNRCENPQCGCEPKAYKCHHLDCGKLIFLSDDKSTINFARCVNMPEPARPVIKQKPQKNEADVLQKGIQLGRLKVEKARIDVELKGLNEHLQPIKPRKQKEVVEASFDDYYDRNMTGVEIVRRKKAEIALKFKNDPDELERQNLLIDQWARNHLDLM